MGEKTLQHRMRLSAARAFAEMFNKFNALPAEDQDVVIESCPAASPSHPSIAADEDAIERIAKAFWPE